MKSKQIFISIAFILALIILVGGAVFAIKPKNDSADTKTITKVDISKSTPTPTPSATPTTKAAAPTPTPTATPTPTTVTSKAPVVASTPAPTSTPTPKSACVDTGRINLPEQLTVTPSKIQNWDTPTTVTISKANGRPLGEVLITPYEGAITSVTSIKTESLTASFTVTLPYKDPIAEYAHLPNVSLLSTCGQDMYTGKVTSIHY